MQSLAIWKLIARSLREKIPVMLLYVVESTGSSPGRQGFFMAVNAREEMEGSIGGGMMEHKFVEMAKEQLREEKSEQHTDLRKQIHSKSAAKNQSGMICSGEQTILLYLVQPKDLPAIECIIVSIQADKNGTLSLFPGGIDFNETPPGKDFELLLNNTEDWLYKEKTGYKQQLFIIGGGHCALALSQLMVLLGFYVRVYDNRPGLKTMLENESAHETHFIDDYKELTALVPPGQNHYVVIMTFGYRSDDIAVRALIGKQFRFIGLLGSKTKVSQLLDEYRKENLDEAWLQQLHTPVGISIKSQTPAEIAVSIAAEIIQEKNK